MLPGENGNWQLDLSGIGPLFGEIVHWVLLVLLYIVGILFFVVLVRFLFSLMRYLLLAQARFVVLELTPPAHLMKEARATAEFFQVLHGLASTKPWHSRALGARQSFSLEIVSTKQGGIRYYVRVMNEDVATVEHLTYSYLPDCKIARVEDYMKEPRQPARYVRLKQTGHFAMPLGHKEELVMHDPIAFLTGAMTKLGDDELVALQYIAEPTSEKEAEEIRNKLLVNADLLAHTGNRTHKHKMGRRVAWLISDAMFSMLDGIGELISPTTRVSYATGGARTVASHFEQAELGIRPARDVSYIEQLLHNDIQAKIAKAQFRVDIRLSAYGSSAVTRSSRISGLRAAFSSFDVQKYQQIRPKPYVFLSLFPALKRRVFVKRLPSLLRRDMSVFSTDEMADLFHFPFAGTTNTDNVNASITKTIAAPISLKANPELDVLVGMNEHHGTKTPIGLTAKEREKHMYMVGGTGNGKTTMLEYMVVQDIKAGKGVTVIDPHGDMAERLLGYIPEDRLDDVIYFKPEDLSYPIGINLLEIDPHLEGDDLLKMKRSIRSSVVSLLGKLFSGDTSAYRIEHILRYTVKTALTVKDATLFTIDDLLNDAAYRRKVIRKLTEPDLLKFWKSEFGNAGGFQKVKMSSSVTPRISPFLLDEAAQRMFSQTHSTIDFLDILNSKKILICNLAKGLTGEDYTDLFGAAILAKLQLASLSRISMEQENRVPHYVYVDEFQNFATPSFTQILSESRKFGLFLTMAQQTTAQLDDKNMINEILANVGTLVTFNTGSEQDEKMLLPLFAPLVEPGMIKRLPAFNYYIRISASRSQEPMSGITTVLQDKPDVDMRERVRAASRQNYAITYSSVDSVNNEVAVVPSEVKSSTKTSSTKRTGKADKPARSKPSLYDKK